MTERVSITPSPSPLNVSIRSTVLKVFTRQSLSRFSLLPLNASSGSISIEKYLDSRLKIWNDKKAVTPEHRVHSI